MRHRRIRLSFKVMGQRIASHFSRRFEFPMKAGIEDCTALTKTGVPGPFTRAQYVELLWRVKEIRILASASYEYVFSDAEGAEPLTGTISMDITLFARSGDGVGVSNELGILRNSFPDGPFSKGFRDWSPDDTPETSGGMSLTFAIRSMQEDAAGWWLPSPAAGAMGEPQPLSFFIAQRKFLAWDAGGDEETGTWDAGSTYVTLRVDAGTAGSGQAIASTINLSSGAVSFPLYLTVQNSTETAPGTASIEITKWFEYATSTGAAAWNASTGAPANGGPGA